MIFRRLAAAVTRTLMLDAILLAAFVLIGVTVYRVAPAALFAYVGAVLLLVWYVLARPATVPRRQAERQRQEE